jgi:hypothetical protein
MIINYKLKALEAFVHIKNSKIALTVYYEVKILFKENYFAFIRLSLFQFAVVVY